MTDQTKVCKLCGENKVLNEFGITKTKGKPWVNSRCKKCLSKLSVEYQKKNRDKANEKQRRWLVNNKEKDAESRRKWVSNNRDHYLETLRVCNKRARESLSDGYVSHLLRMKNGQLTDELIALKRSQLEIQRYAKQLLKLIKEM